MEMRHLEPIYLSPPTPPPHHACLSTVLANMSIVAWVVCRFDSSSVPPRPFSLDRFPPFGAGATTPAPAPLLGEL